MQGIIVHEAKVFNPYPVLEAGLLPARYNFARLSRETFRQRVVEEAKKLSAEAKKIVFPAAIDYLAVLGLSDIRNLRDLRTGKVYATYSDLDALRAEMAGFAFLQEDGLSVWPEFDATINYPLELGGQNISVSIGLSGLLGFEKGRAIHISAPFDGSSSAHVGLRSLKQLFPEMLLEETLWAIPLPEEIRELYMKSQDYLAMFYGLPDYDSLEQKRLEGEAVLAHFEFLDPILPKLGIRPVSVSYSAGSPVLKNHYETRHAQIRSLKEAVELYAKLPADVVFPKCVPMKFKFTPNILSDNDFFIAEAEIAYGMNTRFSSSPLQYAITVYNPSREDILERILDKVAALN